MTQRLNLPPNDRLHLFIQNLEPALQEYVILGNPKNYDEAERLARLKSSLLYQQQKSDTVEVPRGTLNLIQGMLDSKSRPSITATEPEYFHSEGNLPNFEQAHLTRRDVVNIVEQILGCSQRGNNKIRNRNFDRHRFSSNRTTTGQPVCTRCHLVGHTARSCN